FSLFTPCCYAPHRHLHSLPTRRSSDLALAMRLLIDNNTQLLEPIMKIEVEAPEQYTGDVIGDLSSRRGIVEEMTNKPDGITSVRSEEHTSELQSRENLVCRLLLEKKKK